MLTNKYKGKGNNIMSGTCPICGRLEPANPLGMTSHIMCDTCTYETTADGVILTDMMAKDDVEELERQGLI